MNNFSYQNKKLRRYLLIPVLIATLLLPQTLLFNKLTMFLVVLIFSVDAAYNIKNHPSLSINPIALLEVLCGILLGIWIIVGE